MPRPALDVRRPFTRADAAAAGVDPKVLRTSRYRRIFRDVYVSADVPDSPALRADAALALHPPTAFLSHTDAARFYRLPVPDTPDVHVTVPSQRDRRARPGVRCHIATAPPRVVEVRGRRVSHPFRMFIELASMLSLVDLVVVGDAMVRVFGIEPERLVKELAGCSERHVVAARRAAGHVRAEVDSPMETRLRMLLVLAGLPEPTVNLKLRDEHGEVVMRFDLSYPAVRLAVEYDGRQHAEDTGQWNHDVDRRELIDDIEWQVVVVTSKGIYREPARTIERVRSKLLKRGCRDMPRRLSDAWRPHFPCRSRDGVRG